MAARTPRVVKLRPAVGDLVENADFLARQGGLAVAQRFVAQVEATVEALARRPGLGAPWGDDAPELRAVRYAPVPRFPNHLIFYRPIEGGIELMRVLHGAQDLERILRPPENR